MVGRVREAQDGRWVRGCGRVEAGELEREHQAVRRARGEAVRVVADDDAGAVGLADPGEDDRSRVVGLVAAVAGAERLRLDAEAPFAGIGAPGCCTSPVP